MDTREPEDKKPSELAHRSHGFVMRQFFGTALGEAAAFSIAIGAVYGSERLFPKQAASFVAHLTEKLGKWRGLSQETQTELAKKILDVGIMNMAGASGMAVQYAYRRANQSPEEKTPAWYEAGRLAAGRTLGTLSAIGALTFMNIHAAGTMKKMQGAISCQLGSTLQSDRFAELLVSNSVQTIGAIAGNVPAQLLYDQLVSLPARNISK